MVPIISWVSAGRWREPDVALDEPLEWLPVTFKTPNVFGLRVDGDSMEPDFPPGTIIFVDPDRKAEAMNLVIALNGDDEATFKRLTKEGGVWYLTPLNPRYPLQKLDSLCKIIGVVIMASRWTV
jgi:SOS-response transcriptional repressor LexA